MTGSVFTGELKPAAAGLDRLQLAWLLLRRQFGWVGVGLAVSGIISLWARRQTSLLLLTGLGFLAFVAFNLIYFIGDVFVLFIPAWVFVSLWIGLGSLGLADWLARRFVQRRMARRTFSLRPMEQRLGQHLPFYYPGLDGPGSALTAGVVGRKLQRGRSKPQFDRPRALAGDLDVRIYPYRCGAGEQ
jgi:hypothetical protein